MIKRISLYLMALIYIAAGSYHFINPQKYEAIIPPWLPWPEALVFITGVVEIIAGFFLLPVSTRRKAAWVIIVLLIIVFPANVQMMLNYMHEKNTNVWIAILRLPLQILLIWWAYIFTKPVYPT